jgi:hypothetical protein
MATASIKTRSIQGESLSAATDRLVNSVLLTEGVVDKAGDSFKVAQNTGSDMNVKIGSGTAFDRAVVAGDLAGQGTFILEHQNATQTLAIAAAHATLPRIDIAIARVRDDTFDSSGLDEADLEIVTGTAAGSPSVPATPSGAYKLAEIAVAAAVTAITNGNITDTRVEAPVHGQLVQTVYFTVSGSFVKADYPWLANVRARVQGGGGAGGGAAATAAGETSGGSGGGGGAYAESLLDVSVLAASETVTVGGTTAGGSGAGSNGANSSFGSHVSANGGNGGASVLAASAAETAVSGTTRQATATGDLIVAGGPGGGALRTGVRVISGQGGDSHLGGGGAAQASGTSAAGQNGVQGGGGSGASNGASQSAANGGTGAAGIVILDLYA